MMKKALFFDIDGTLVSFKTHEIPGSTIEAIRKAHERGNKIFISTGRPYVIINNLKALQEKNLIDGYITMNGAYCFIGDDILYKSAIPQDEVRRLAEICRKKGYACIFVTEDEIKVVQPTEEVRKIFNEFLHVQEIPHTEFEDVVDKTIYQMTVFITEDIEKEVAKQMPGSEFNRWYPTFVDITAKGNTKAHGIEIMMNSIGFPQDASIAFGDGGNDIPMLEKAAIGVAMGNANDDVKAHAQLVTDTVDNGGIAKALEELNLTD